MGVTKGKHDFGSMSCEDLKKAAVKYENLLVSLPPVAEMDDKDKKLQNIWSSYLNEIKDLKKSKGCS